MNRWYLAALLASIVIPSSALLVVAHGRRVDLDEDRSNAIADALVDAPGADHGLIENSLTFIESLRSRGPVSRASNIAVGPVLVGTAKTTRLGRLEGVKLDERLNSLLGITLSGDPGELAKNAQSVGIGSRLAAELDVEVGDDLQILALAPGPQALGFRRKSLEVVAIFKGGLDTFDRTTLVTSLSTSRELLGVDEGSMGALAWLDGRISLEEGSKRLATELGEDRRVRPRNERDRPLLDDVASLKMAQSTLLLVLVSCFLLLPLIGFRRAGSYAEQLGRYIGVAGGALVVALALGAGTSLLLDDGQLQWIPAARTDLGRLFFAAAAGLLVSPLLADRIGRGSAAAALCAVIALASVEPVGASVVGSGAARTAARLTEAASTTRELAHSGPLRAAALSGAEVVPAELLGLDPGAPTSTKLLQHLCDEGPNETPEKIDLRPEGSQRPAPWQPSQQEAIDSLLDQLAESGDATKAAREQPRPHTDKNHDRPAPPIVLGHGLARRLGVGIDDDLLIAAAPTQLTLDGEHEPPWPARFRVAAIAKLGVTGIDDRLAIADTWQVEALGGGPRAEDEHQLSTDGSIFAGLDTLVERAEAPFAARARRAAVAGALQLSLVACFLGLLIARSPRPPWLTILGWSAIGLLAGLLLGFNEGAGGLIEIGAPHWYEVLPRGRARVTDVLGLWSCLPAIVAAVAALMGALIGRHQAARR